MSDSVLQDFRIALRQLFKSKAFTITAIVTLALGLGANTAIFTLIDAVMLLNLPVAKPEQLLRLGDSYNCCVIGGYQGDFSIFAYPLYTSLRDHTPEFEEMAAFRPHGGLGHVGARRVGTNAAPESSVEQLVSGNYFSMFGLNPFAGRLLNPSDDQRGAAPVAVMSYKTWQTHYGSDPGILGASFVVDGLPLTVVGIAPPGFFGDTLSQDPPDFWAPLSIEPLLHPGAASLVDRTSDYWLYIIGRVKPGTPVAPLEAKVNAELRQWMMENDPPTTESAKTSFAKMHLTISPGGAGISSMRRNYADDLRLLLAITGLVLLVACANLANLQLARGAERGSETAVRAALGASRMRLVRLTLIESLILAVVGGGAGLLVADWLSNFLIGLAFHTATIPIDTRPSLPVLGFALLLSLITAVVFGVAPACSGSRTDPAQALRGSGRSTSRRVTLMQRSLVIVQTALSIVLLAGAGLMLQTLRNLADQKFGYQSSGRMIVNVHAGFGGYSPAKFAAIYDEVERRVKQIPGVLNVAMSLYAPMEGDNWQTGVSVEERPGQIYSPSWDRVSRGFFDTLGSRILRGRMFDERDTPDSTHVAVVNQTFVDKIFPNEDPVGKRFGQGAASHAADYQIIGVVEDVRFRNPREHTPPMYFLPLLQMSPIEWSSNTKARSNIIKNIELHAAAVPADLNLRIKQTLASVDPNLALVNIATLDDQLANQLNHERLLSRLAQLFGLLALAVASVGLYGITAYSVAQRTSEIGIRGALGASRTQFLRMILRGALTQAGLGILAGIPVALAAGRLLADQVYGVKTYDLRILGGTALVLLVCACAAGIGPAVSASSIDPARTLRAE
jgi:predicted permease